MKPETQTKLSFKFSRNYVVTLLRNELIEGMHLSEEQAAKAQIIFYEHGGDFILFDKAIAVWSDNPEL